MYGFLTYDENGERFISAPCGCPECTDSVQPGHSQCDPAPAALVAAETAGDIQRHYIDGAWRWVVIYAPR